MADLNFSTPSGALPSPDPDLQARIAALGPEPNITEAFRIIAAWGKEQTAVANRLIGPNDPRWAKSGRITV